MNEKNNIITFPSKSQSNCVTCAMCGSSKVTTKWLKDSFEYGSGEAKVHLEAEIPVHSCAKCSIEFTDHSADLIQHEAVCRHLGLLSPSEVRAVRMSMSKAEFSRRTGIGQASLNRWEKGAVLQNVAMDNFLYLLSLNGNFEALQERQDNTKSIESVSTPFQIIDITDEKMKQRAMAFNF